MLVSSGHVLKLDSTGPPLGILVDAAWEERILTLQTARRVILYTDGIPEAGVPANDLGEKGLMDLLRETAGADLAAQIKQALQDASLRSDNRLPDDATLMAFEVLRPEPPF